MRAHALEVWPEPACGVVVGTAESPEFLPVGTHVNLARDSFRLGGTEAMRLKQGHDGLLGLMISHPDDSNSANPDPLLFTPSAAEMRAQMALAAPFAVVVCTASTAYVPWWFGDQRPTPGIIGRPFRHGVLDCYSFVRDWYRQEYGISIPDFPRDWEWWRKGQDLYREGFYRAGGRCIDPADARPGDVVLCRIRSRVTNHAVVLMPDGWVGHHFGSTVPYDPGAVSRVQRAGRWLAKLRTHTLRWHRHAGEASSAG